MATPGFTHDDNLTKKNGTHERLEKHSNGAMLKKYRTLDGRRYSSVQESGQSRSDFLKTINTDPMEGFRTIFK